MTLVVQSASPRPLVRVAAAVILRDGKVLLAQRPPGKVYAGYWEFPGGKLEAGETPRHALDRELLEELGIVVRRATPWLVRRYEYEHAHVELHFQRVLAFDGAPVGHDGQAFEWQMPGQFTVAPLLPANAPILAALTLPAVYGISIADDCGEGVFLERARAAFDRGLSLVQVREKTWPPARVRTLVERLLAVAQRHGAKVLLNGDAVNARAWGCHGVHWTARELMLAAMRPADLMCGASCHDAREIARAGALGLDFAVLGPVLRTPTHPHARPLGWDGFGDLIRASEVPVFALGGLAHDDLEVAIEHGAHGIAMRRGAW